LKGLEVKELGEDDRERAEKRNVTFALHLCYIWRVFERCSGAEMLHWQATDAVFSFYGGFGGLLPGFRLFAASWLPAAV